MPPSNSWSTSPSPSRARNPARVACSHGVRSPAGTVASIEVNSSRAATVSPSATALLGVDRRCPASWRGASSPSRGPRSCAIFASRMPSARSPAAVATAGGGRRPGRAHLDVGAGLRSAGRIQVLPGGGDVSAARQDDRHRRRPHGVGECVVASGRIDRLERGGQSTVPLPGVMEVAADMDDERAFPLAFAEAVGEGDPRLVELGVRPAPALGGVGEVEVGAQGGCGRLLLERDSQGAVEQAASLLRARVQEQQRLGVERVGEHGAQSQGLSDLDRVVDGLERVIGAVHEPAHPSELGCERRELRVVAAPRRA